MSTQTKNRTRSLRRKALIALSACLAMGAMAVPSASANLEFESVGVNLTETPKLNESFEYPKYGPFLRQAGSHPDFTFSFVLPVDPNAEIGGVKSPGPPEAVHKVELDLPPGFVGNPTGIETCMPLKLTNPGVGASKCPVASQVGVVEAVGRNTGGPFPFKVGLYNIAHGPNIPARFGFNYLGAVSFVTARVRPGEYGISSGSDGIAQTTPIQSAKVTLWGVPADPSHDLRRQGPEDFGVTEFFPIPTEAPRVPFLTAPTSCADTPISFTARGDSWEHPGIFDERTLTADEDGTPLVFEGCEKLPFGPTVDVRPLSKVADSPTGLNVDVDVPQTDDPDGLATAHVRKIVTKLPAGVSISPSSAAGLGACSPSQIDLTSIDAPTCPNASKIARVTIDTPLLSEPLQGDMILATPYDNPFGSLIAVYVAVKGPNFWIKLPGKVDLDPNTGQITATFDNSPQQPFSHLHVAFPAGPDASLQTPSKCGTYNAEAEVTSWASPVPVSLSSPMTIDEGCDTGAFKPDLSAGSVSPNAGAFTPFSLRLTRQDGEQNISRIQATLPEGVLAKLAGVPVCAQVATGNCPAASQVGTTVVGAGPGSNPIYVPQPGKAPTAIYLAGPYKGAPYSLVVKVPAQAGPFDLGTVVVRSALNVDPVTTQVTATSDPLPQVLQGIPISYRDVRVEVSRNDFTLNPTGCDPKQVTSTLTSAQGKTASPSTPFQAVNCERLAFKPKLALSLSGKTNRSSHPKLKATLTMPKGNANIASAAVTLPKTEFLENAHIKTICTRVQYSAGNCPKASVYGHARAWSPLLDKPLEGPVYLRSSSHELPDLVASLDGAIHVDLAGRIDSVDARIRNTFDFVPDAPVSKFVLTMQGGKKGLLVNNTNICRATPRAQVDFDAQNGKASDSSPAVRVDGCGSGKAKRK